MDSSEATDIEVTLAAIDGDYLVLESLIEKIRFKWPLNKIPRPLEIGTRLTIKLQNRNASLSTPGKRDTEETMRKLLENLVN